MIGRITGARLPQVAIGIGLALLVLASVPACARIAQRNSAATAPALSPEAVEQSTSVASGTTAPTESTATPADSPVSNDNANGATSATTPTTGVAGSAAVSATPMPILASGPVASAPTATPTGPPSQPLPACAVAKIEQLPPDGTIAFPGYFATTVKNAAQVYQLHLTNPDGSPGPCLTCSAHPGGPALDRNKMVPYVEPTGHWVLFTVEWSQHAPYVGQDWQKYLELANGWYEDLWAVSVDGQKFVQLTNYASTDKFAGIVADRVSKNGSTIIWSKLVGRPDRIHAHGYYQLYEAQFLAPGATSPSLTNIKNITNPKGTWYEPEDFSPDSTKFTLVTNIESSDAGGDIWELDVASGTLKNLTKTPNKWDEHSRYSPSGAKIAWMSSYPYDINPLTNQTTKTELMIMNSDGTGVQQLTHFNTPSYAEYSPEKSAAGTPEWSADGRQIIIDDLFLGARYPQRRWFKITFSEACGGRVT